MTVRTNTSSAWSKKGRSRGLPAGARDVAPSGAGAPARRRPTTMFFRHTSPTR
jgi:hypothetical protein